MQSAQGELKKTADVAQSNSERMAQVGKVAFAGLGVAAVGFGVLAVKAFMDHQRAAAQTEAVLNSTGAAANVTAEQVDQLATSIQNMSGLSGEAVQAGENMLLTFTNIRNGVGEGNDVFNQATRVLADMSVALGTDMATSAIRLGKALNDPIKGITALTRVGVTFTDQQKNQIQALVVSGKTMEAQKIILAELNREFGGSAEALGNTFGGQLNILKERTLDFFEAVGGQLVPVLSRLVGVAADAAGWFTRHQAILGALAGIIGGPLVAAMGVYATRQAMAFSESIMGTVGGITRAVFGLAAAEEAAAGAATSLGTAEILATGGLSAIGAVIGGLAIHFLGQSDATKEAGSSAAGLGTTMQGLSSTEADLGDETDATTASLNAQSNMFKQLNGDANAQTGEILKLLGDQQSLDRATKTLNETTKRQADLQKDAKAATSGLADAQKKLNTATDEYNKLQAGLGQRISKDQNHAHHDLEQAQLTHEEAQTRLNEAVAEYGPQSNEARQASLDLESATFSLTDAQEAMGHVGEDAWSAIDAAQQKVLDAKDGVTAAIDKQREAIEKTKQPAADVAANTLAWQQAQNTLNTDWEKFQGLIAAHPELREQMVTQIGNLKANLPKGADIKPLNDLLDKLNAYGATLSKVAPPGSMLDAILSGKMLFGAPMGPPLPPPTPPGQDITSIITGGTTIFGGGAAEGAVVKARPGGRLMLVAEGGNDEAIVPLDKAGSNLGAGVTININGYDKDKRALALEVRDELVRLGRNNVGVGLG